MFDFHKRYVRTAKQKYTQNPHFYPIPRRLYDKTNYIYYNRVRVLSYQKNTDRIRKNQKTRKAILVFSMSREAFWCYQDKMIVYDVSYLKPHIVAKKLGITTSALRMRRFRGSEDIDTGSNLWGWGVFSKHFALYQSHQVPKFYCAARRNGEMSNKI